MNTRKKTRITGARRSLAASTHLAWPGLAFGLALVLALEWLVPGPGAQSRPPAALPKLAAAASPGAADQWTATVLARPLFTPGRRPDGATGAGGDGTLPRLSAIIVSDQGASAVFSPDGQKPQLLRVGGAIDGYQLQAIRADQVQLLGPAGPLTVRPRFAQAALPAAAAPTAPAAAPATAPAISVSTAPPPGPVPALNSPYRPLPPATQASNPALYLEQNF